MKKIQFIDVTFGYKKSETLFKSFNFDFINPFTDKGYIYALMGSSGSGKSTILKLILDTVKPNMGKLNIFPDEPIISYLPQEAILFDHLTPLENAMYFKYTANHKKHFDFNLFQQLTEALGMKSILEKSKKIDELSGGQRQRINLLRALSIRPDILLLDEPTNGLDAEIKLQFLQQLREIILKHNLLAIYITHNKIEAELIGDAIAYLYFDNQKNSRTLFSDTILNFIKTPPILEARKIFQYPVPNILKVHFDNSKMKLTENDNFDTFYLSIEANNIEFTNSSGFDFEIAAANSVYTNIKLDLDQQLVIDSNYFIQNCVELKNNKININGSLLRYNSFKNYTDTIQLMNNKLIN